jgi:hypothetical protein
MESGRWAAVFFAEVFETAGLAAGFFLAGIRQ